MYLVLYAFGFGALIIAWLLRDEPPMNLVMIAPGVVLLYLGLSFQHLTVRDEGDRLAIRFGPLPLFKTSVKYSEIEGVEVGRTLLLDGLGIHMSLRGGWVWNLWGRDCVVVNRRGRSVLRIGTDDAANLARFLQSKAPPPT